MLVLVDSSLRIYVYDNQRRQYFSWKTCLVLATRLYLFYFNSANCLVQINQRNCLESCIYAKYIKLATLRT